jgi:hypothetical protein
MCSYERLISGRRVGAGDVWPNLRVLADKDAGEEWIDPI